MDIQNSAQRLRWLCEIIPTLIKAIPESDFTSKPAPGKWSKKEILGHLIDSAANNHQRFIRIQAENEPVIFYDQDQWNTLSHYNETESDQVIQLWKWYNLHLASLAEVIPPENLSKNGSGRDGQKHTLKWYIDDYVEHMEHHLRQIVVY
ncbi:DinB family protein [Dyadobacter sp. MSC1_007]|jgi:hypothetical protein|uniref:DinB family protein n=1 Tax=Dyadobacter sp. MSC1_007 TaxID=2909264 RepID=UPI002030B0C7|nr:DinB family protein [Dyadobacter sp. MSC1_007]